jgi:hypothetical protein
MDGWKNASSANALALVADTAQHHDVNKIF